MEKTFLLLMLSVLLLQGCSAHMRDPENQAAALVYGYMDMDEAPSSLSYATLKQYKPVPKEDEAYWNTVGVDGMFWWDQIIPGSFQLVHFSGSSWWKNAVYNYSMPEYQKNDSAIVIKKPGLYYLGAYKYKDTGSWFSPKFDIEKTRTPTEKELLTKLLPYSTGTKWEALIRKRIGELQ